MLVSSGATHVGRLFTLREMSFMSLHTLARVGKSVTERVCSFRTLYSTSLMESMARTWFADVFCSVQSRCTRCFIYSNVVASYLRVTDLQGRNAATEMGAGGATAETSASHSGCCLAFCLHLYLKEPENEVEKEKKKRGARARSVKTSLSGILLVTVIWLCTAWNGDAAAVAKRLCFRPLPVQTS